MRKGIFSMTDTTNTEALAIAEALEKRLDCSSLVLTADVERAAAELRRLLAERDKFASEAAQHFVRAREWAERAGQMEAERDALRTALSNLINSTQCDLLTSRPEDEVLEVFIPRAAWLAAVQVLSFDPSGNGAPQSPEEQL